MGVDYFPCSSCKTVICDAGDYGTCDNCYDSFCEDCADETKSVYFCSRCEKHQNDCKCSREERDIEQHYLCTKCVDGRGPSSGNLIAFLIEKAGFDNYTETVKAYYASKGQIPTRTVIKKEDGKVVFVEVDRYGSEDDYDFDAPSEEEEEEEEKE